MTANIFKLFFRIAESKSWTMQVKKQNYLFELFRSRLSDVARWFSTVMDDIHNSSLSSFPAFQAVQTETRFFLILFRVCLYSQIFSVDSVKHKPEVLPFDLATDASRIYDMHMQCRDLHDYIHLSHKEVAKRNDGKFESFETNSLCDKYAILDQSHFPH